MEKLINQLNDMIAGLAMNGHKVELRVDTGNKCPKIEVKVFKYVTGSELDQAVKDNELPF